MVFIYTDVPVSDQLALDVVVHSGRYVQAVLGKDKEFIINIDVLEELSAEGYTYLTDDNEVQIQIRHSKSMLETLAHELVHAVQFLEGRLQDNCIWEGISYDKVPHSLQPWELEAYMLEHYVYTEYFKKVFDEHLKD